MVDLVCQGCGATFLVSEIVASKGRKFCSQRCSTASFVKSNTKRPQYAPGDRVGRLTLIEVHQRGRQPSWKVRCDCGNEKIARTSHMQAGRIISCRCHRIEDKIRHGMSDSPEWHIWSGIISRATNPDHADAHLYSQRGISVCDAWINGGSKGSGFQHFYQDMGPRPSPQHSVDRVDVNGNYEPGNCRWATPAEQARNRRQNIYVDVGGTPMCLIDAVPILSPSLGYECVLGRIYRGWPVDKALTEPKRPGKPLRTRTAA